MANVFISYARRDRERVLAFASALEHEGLSVWWDPNLVPGKRFRDIIERELSAADSVVVVWTAASILSDYVQDEAEEARQRGVFVPITLEPVKPPAGFRQVQAADLTQWTGSSQHPEFRMVVTAIRALVEGARPADVREAAATPATPPAQAAAQPASSAPAAGPAHPDAMFLPRLFDLFARPVVWGVGAVAVALGGVQVGFGLSGTAAAMVLWAGAMAGAGVGAGMEPNRKTTVMVVSLGVTLIVAASTHSPGGLVTAILVGGAVFAGMCLNMIRSGRREARRRAPREDTRSHRAYWTAIAKEARDAARRRYRRRRP